MPRLFRLFLATLLHTFRRRWARGPARATWSFRLEVIVSYLRRDWDETSDWDFARYRADLEARPYPRGAVARTTRHDGELGGVSARWFVPPRKLAADSHQAHTGEPRAIVLFLHGGSYIYGSARTTHADLIARLALASGLTVVGIDYRLAPEHPYPAQLDDATRAFDALVAEGRSPGEILLAGDSAGGNLAIELQLRLRERAGLTSQARAAMLISPWSDLTMPGRSFVDNDAFDFGTRTALARHAQAFAGDVPLDDPRISPVNADLRGLAPMLVMAGEAEIPRDDILRLGDRLARAGVEVERHLAPDMPHNAPLFAAYHPSAREALDVAASFLRRHGVSR